MENKYKFNVKCIPHDREAIKMLDEQILIHRYYHKKIARMKNNTKDVSRWPYISKALDSLRFDTKRRKRDYYELKEVLSMFPVLIGGNMLFLYDQAKAFAESVSDLKYEGTYNILTKTDWKKSWKKDFIRFDRQNIKENSMDFVFANSMNPCKGGILKGYRGQCNAVAFLREAYMALSMLKRGGGFIIKFNDICNAPTLDIIHILNSVFAQAYIYKPVSVASTLNHNYMICVDYERHVGLNALLKTLRNIIACRNWKKNILYNILAPGQLDPQMLDYVEAITAPHMYQLCLNIAIGRKHDTEVPKPNRRSTKTRARDMQKIISDTNKQAKLNLRTWMSAVSI